VTSVGVSRTSESRDITFSTADSRNSPESISADEGPLSLAVAPDVHSYVSVRRVISHPDIRQRTCPHCERRSFLFACFALLRFVESVQLETDNLYLHGNTSCFWRGRPTTGGAVIECRKEPEIFPTARDPAPETMRRVPSEEGGRWW
jgi:hypothetical protein